MTKHLHCCSRLMIVLLFAAAALAETGKRDAFTGTWKINIPKSKPAFPMDRKGKTITFVSDGTFIIDYIENGKAVRSSHRWSGGAEVPIEGTAIWTKNATVIGTLRDDHTYEEQIKVNGKLMERARLVVSPDGKILTMTAEGKDDKGQTVRDVEVYDKQ